MDFVRTLQDGSAYSRQYLALILQLPNPNTIAMTLFIHYSPLAYSDPPATGNYFHEKTIKNKIH